MMKIDTFGEVETGSADSVVKTCVQKVLLILTYAHMVRTKWLSLFFSVAVCLKQWDCFGASFGS